MTPLSKYCYCIYFVIKYRHFELFEILKERKNIAVVVSAWAGTFEGYLLWLKIKHINNKNISKTLPMLFLIKYVHF